MRLLPKNTDYACFMDGDAMFTTHYFGHQIHHITEKHNDCGLFTAVTNRVGTNYQLIPGMWDNNNIATHWAKGNELYKRNYGNCDDITHKAPISGVLILLRKKEWQRAGGFLEDKMLGIDNSIHYRVRDNGGKVKLMLGVYVLHYYRGGNIENKKHLTE